ncbi:MAG: glycosyltransferase family 2 protein [Planctomycetes bacterium]|nr:glycosyltransferase family 2 protein [Planctomycetota bacterium]MCC7169470.1 glycosyltransferase family 2 protein [Planctomycetota bacterium]
MFSAVVPVFNEEHRIAASLTQLADFLRSRFQEGFEIVAVNDGSKDGSANALAMLDPRLHVTVLHNGMNFGKGCAVRRGMLAAQGDPIVFMDADLSTPLTELDRFVPLVAAGNDIVIGTRKHKDAQITQAQNSLRTYLGLGYTRLVNTILGLGFSDYTCGFKLFSREAARSIFARSVVDRWSFDAEILFLARRLHFKVAEVPVSWADQPQSKVRVARDMATSLAELMAIRLNALKGRYGP